MHSAFLIIIFSSVKIDSLQRDLDSIARYISFRLLILVAGQL